MRASVIERFDLKSYGIVNAPGATKPPLNSFNLGDSTCWKALLQQGRELINAYSRERLWLIALIGMTRRVLCPVLRRA